jgi:endoglucanase
MSLSVRGNQFVVDGQPVRLRGVGLANWLNLEHFMFGMPGTESEIRGALRSVYGDQAADAFWRSYYDCFLAEADLIFLAELGFNCMRLPVNARAFADGAAFEESVAIRELERVIPLCEKRGLFCVLDLHAAPGGQNPDWHCDNTSGDYPFFRNEVFRAQTVALWGRIARHFKGSSALVGYDLLNEPHYFEKSLDAALLRFYTDCIETIRGVDERPIIFLEGSTYARDFSMLGSDLDANVACSFHYYPFLQLSGRLDGPDLKDRIRDSLYRDVTMRHLQETLGRPLWCGETGHPLHQLGSVHALGTYLELLEELDISWSLWPHKDARAMGLCYPKPTSRYLSLVKQASADWSFRDMFQQDTTQTTQNDSDKHAFYRRLAAASTEANACLQRGLAAVPFENLLASVADWRFDRCERNEALIRCLPKGKP